MKNTLFSFGMAMGLLALGLLLTNCQPKTATNTSNAGNALLNQQIQSTKNTPMMVGKINRSGLQQEPYKGWFDEGYQKYTVDAGTLQSVKDKLKSTEILIFMGTWCGDSKREVPHFYKILDNVGYSEKKLQVVALDNHPERYKKSPQGEEKGWNIEYVPTIIFLKEGKELGRIVETPQETLEKDLAAIISK